VSPANIKLREVTLEKGTCVAVRMTVSWCKPRISNAACSDPKIGGNSLRGLAPFEYGSYDQV